MDHNKTMNNAIDLMVEKKYDEALKLLDELADDADNFRHYYFLRASCKYYAQKVEAAIADLKKGLEIYPEDIELPKLLASIYYNEGRFPEAIEYFSRLYYYNEDSLSAIYWRLMARMNMRDADGKLIDKEGALQDGMKLIPHINKFIEENNTESIIPIKNLEIGKDGFLHFDTLE